MRSRRTVWVAACVGLLPLLAGCYEEIEPQPQAGSQQTRSGQPEEQPGQRQVSAGGGSALGGAKRSAQSVVDQAEKRSQEIADEFDDFPDPD